jgi:hypothetical protein
MDSEKSFAHATDAEMHASDSLNLSSLARRPSVASEDFSQNKTRSSNSGQSKFKKQNPIISRGEQISLMLMQRLYPSSDIVIGHNVGPPKLDPLNIPRVKLSDKPKVCKPLKIYIYVLDNFERKEIWYSSH